MNIYKKLTDWYFTKRAVPYWCVLVLDCFIVLLSGIVSSYLDIGGYELTTKWYQIVFGLLCCLPFYIICFHFYHTYLGIVRYSSSVDFFRVCKAMFVASVGVAMLGMFSPNRYIIFPQWETAIFIFLAGTFLMWVVRILVKVSYEAFQENKSVPIAIYGTQAGGVAIFNSLTHSTKDKHYHIATFISDRKEQAGNYFFGKKILHNNDDVVKKLESLGVKALLVSPLKTIRFRNNQKLIDELTNAGIKIIVIPEAEEWDGKTPLDYSQMREVQVEELLPRDKIEVDMDAIGKMLAGKRILITGAAGSIGSEMARQVAKFGPAELILIDQAETPMHDVRLYMARKHAELKVWTIVGTIINREQMDSIFAAHRPEYVFHAAAYKHVPMMEDNPSMAIQNNVYGTRVIADLAVKYGTKKFVMISTDKAVNPTNVMGCSKRICEIYCQSLNNHLREQEAKNASANGNTTEGCQFITTRFGNVLGSNGSVIPIFAEQIKKGGPVMVTHPDIIRFFMLIPEACRLVLEAGTMGKGGEIFVFDMGEPVRIVDLARRMIKLSGAKDVEIKFSGLRDGEKLYEEVLSDKEHTKPTCHPKIMVASVREYPYALAQQNEDELLMLSRTFDDMAIVKKMKEIVPEYKSQHSKYQELDSE